MTETPLHTEPPLPTAPALQAVVFDFDGTLAELHIDFHEMRAAINELAAGFSLEPKDYAEFYILEMIETAGRHLGRRSAADSQDFVNRATGMIEEREMQAARKSELFPGVKEMLTMLKDRGVAIGIITRNCQAAVQTVFPDYPRYIGAIISREMTRFVKPDPRHLTEMLTMLAVTPTRTLMVGDHPIDVRIGRDVGTLTAGVLTGTGSVEDLRRTKPDFLLDNVLQVTDIVLNHHRPA
jgi:phosphoglycolate phosphatase